MCGLEALPYVLWRHSAFDADDEKTNYGRLDAIHSAISVAYLFAIVLTHFFTSYIDHENLIEIFQLRRITEHVLTSWSWWSDLLSVSDLPFQVSSLLVTGEGRPELMLLGLLRIRHLRNVPSFVSYSNWYHFLRLVVITFFTAHCTACTWWAVVNRAGTKLQHFELTLVKDHQSLNEYTYAMYLAVLMMLGRGPRVLSNSEMQLAAVLGLSGTLLMAVIFGQMNMVVQRSNTLDSMHVEKIARVKQALSNMTVTKGLRKRILKYHQYIDTMHNDNAAQNLFERLSGPLALELKLNIYHTLVTRAPFFQNTNPEVIKNIIVSLQDAVYLPGDFIIRRGDYGQEMFFIFRGTVEVLNADRAAIASLSSGMYFGEVALLTGRRRGAYVQAATYSILAVLQKDDLELITEDYPEALSSLFQRMIAVCNIQASITLDELRERLLLRFQSLKSAFNAIDVDRKLEISIIDFSRAMKRFNVEKTDSKLLFCMIDKDIQQGSVTWDMFKKALKPSKRKKENGEDGSRPESVDEGSDDDDDALDQSYDPHSLAPSPLPGVAPATKTYSRKSVSEKQGSQVIVPDGNNGEAKLRRRSVSIKTAAIPDSGDNSKKLSVPGLLVDVRRPSVTVSSNMWCPQGAASNRNRRPSLPGCVWRGSSEDGSLSPTSKTASEDSDDGIRATKQGEAAKIDDDALETAEEGSKRYSKESVSTTSEASKDAALAISEASKEAEVAVERAVNKCPSSLSEKTRSGSDVAPRPDIAVLVEQKAVASEIPPLEKPPSHPDVALRPDSSESPPPVAARAASPPAEKAPQTAITTYEKMGAQGERHGRCRSGNESDSSSDSDWKGDLGACQCRLDKLEKRIGSLNQKVDGGFARFKGLLKARLDKDVPSVDVLADFIQGTVTRVVQERLREDKVLSGSKSTEDL